MYYNFIIKVFILISFLVPVKSVDGRKMPSQLQIDSMQLQHPYHHHIPQSGNFENILFYASNML